MRDQDFLLQFEVMDESFWPHFFFFFLLLTATILYGLCVFSFAAPKHFAQWFSPYFWLTRKTFKHRPDRFDRAFSFTLGGFHFLLLILVQFVLGGFFVTALFDLWQSPFALFFRGGGF